MDVSQWLSVDVVFPRTPRRCCGADCEEVALDELARSASNDVASCFISLVKASRGNSADFAESDRIPCIVLC